MKATRWFVNYGVTSRHLWNCKMFYRLADAKEYAKTLPRTKAYNIIAWNDNEKRKLMERLI